MLSWLHSGKAIWKKEKIEKKVEKYQTTKMKRNFVDTWIDQQKFTSTWWVSIGFTHDEERTEKLSKKIMVRTFEEMYYWFVWLWNNGLFVHVKCDETHESFTTILKQSVAKKREKKGW